MKNILIPTDFSENAENAIMFALAYFADIPVNFYVLNVLVESKVHKVEVAYLSQNAAIVNYSELLVTKIKKYRLLSNTVSHNFFGISEKMQLVEAIRKNVAEKKIDYILMGTKGASKINRKEIGTNTSDVITKVKCPVLVIPEHARFEKIQNLLFLTDYNFVYRSKLMGRLSETLSLHSAAIRILHVGSQKIELKASQTDNKVFLNYFFKESKNSFHAIENKNIEDEVQKFVKNSKINLIVLVAKNLNFIERLLFKPKAIIKNNQSEVPFLVLHE